MEEVKRLRLKPQKVILVARPHHARRAYATFIKNTNIGKIISAPCELNFRYSKELSEILVGEIDRLILYTKKGDIQKQKIPKDVMEAYDVLIKSLGN